MQIDYTYTFNIPCTVHIRIHILPYTRLVLLSLLAVSSALPQFYPYQAPYQAAYPGYGVYQGYYPGYYQGYYQGYPVYDQASSRNLFTLSSFQVRVILHCLILPVESHPSLSHPSR